MAQSVKVDDKKLEAIAKAIQNLEFGEVHITIQDGVIVQINRLEKQRFPQKNNNDFSRTYVKWPPISMKDILCLQVALFV